MESTHTYLAVLNELGAPLPKNRPQTGTYPDHRHVSHLFELVIHEMPPGCGKLYPGNAGLLHRRMDENYGAVMPCNFAHVGYG